MAAMARAFPVPASEAPEAMARSAELDRPTALEGGHDLGRRDASACPVRQPRIGLVERGRGSPASKRHDSRYPLTTWRGSWISISSRRLTGVIDLVFTQAG